MTILELLASLGAASVGVALLFRPQIGVCALLAWYPLLTEVPRLGPGLNAQTALIALALAVTLIRVGPRLPPIVATAPVLSFAFVIVMGFVVAGVASTIQDPEFSTWERFKAVKSRIFTALLFFAVYWWAREPDQRRKLLVGISLAVLAVGTAAIVDFVASGGRASGLFENSNYSGAFLGIFSIVPVYLVRCASPSRASRAIHAAVYVVGAIGLILTQSRAAWLAAFLGHTVWLLYETRQLLVLSASALLLVSTIAYPLVPDLVRSRIEQTFAGSSTTYLAGAERLGLDGSSGSRIVMYRIGFDLWLESPIWGHGLDSFRYMAGPAGLRYGFLSGKTAHSLPLKLATETGIIGLIALLHLAIAVFAIGRRAIRTGEPDRKLGVLLIAVGCATGACNMFHQDFLLSGLSSGLFWSLFGIVARRACAPRKVGAPRSDAPAMARSRTTAPVPGA